MPDTQPSKKTANKANTTSPQVQPVTGFTKKAKKPFKITKNTILFTVFVLAWAILANVASQYLVAILMAIPLGKALQQPLWTLIYYIITYIITLALIIFVPPRLVKLYQQRKASTKQAQALEKDLTSTPATMGVQHSPTFVDIGLAPISYIVYLCIANAITSFMSLFTWFDVDQAQDVGFSYYITDLDRIFAMIAIVFIAPIAEELIMRGWLYGKLRSKWNIPVAIILTSLLFAILHGQWNVAVTTFALSAVLCALREITGTIWSGMLLHMLSNGIAFYLLYIAI